MKVLTLEGVRLTDDSVIDPWALSARLSSASCITVDSTDSVCKQAARPAQCMELSGRNSVIGMSCKRVARTGQISNSADAPGRQAVAHQPTRWLHGGYAHSDVG